MHAQIANDTITALGWLPRSARRLDSGDWVLGLADAPVELQQACGWYEVVTTAPPSAPPGQTVESSVEVVGGVPTQVWTVRDKTEDELAEEALEAIDRVDAIEASVLAGVDDTPQPWEPVTGADNAIPPGAQRVFEGNTYRNVSGAWLAHSPAEYPRGWECQDCPTPTDPQPWVPWTGVNEDLYQIGDQVTHNGSLWEATVGNNHWEPGVFGWVQLP